jgi:uncharacterized repeat protein (TIGR03803 family)
MKRFRLLKFTSLLLTFAAAASVQGQQYSVLYNFGSKSGDPINPEGIVQQGRDGNLYSGGNSGGDQTCTANGPFGCGAVFKITPAGVLTTLYSFTGGSDGIFPSGLTLGTDGNLYGTTELGGSSENSGTVFRISPSGSITTLHIFGCCNGGGAVPVGPPVQGMDGNFYGDTENGLDGDAGSIYRITPTGTFTSLYGRFGIPNATNPGALIQGTDGAFYGTSLAGGTPCSANAAGCGDVFKLTIPPNFTVLYKFDGTHGAAPNGPLVQARDGNFYGTTAGGGTAKKGVVFKITPTGSVSVLHNMNGTTDGGVPIAGLVQATDGNFYGVNSSGGTHGAGTIFRIAPGGNFAVLHNFDGTTGAFPFAALLQHTNGILYGGTALGGTGDISPCTAGKCGVFYSLDVGLGPFVRFLPEAGGVGQTIEFLGQGFTGTNGVSFNGTAAAFKVVSDTYLVATVPAGATNGFVTVTTPSGTRTSNKEFRVFPSVILLSTPYPTPPVQGGLLTYAFKVWNVALVAAEHEVLTTQVPAGTTFSGISISGTSGVSSCSTPAVGGTGPVICHENSAMAAHSTWTLRMTVRVTATTGTVITETATASSDNLGSDTVTVRNTVH